MIIGGKENMYLTQTSPWTIMFIKDTNFKKEPKKVKKNPELQKTKFIYLMKN